VATHAGEVRVNVGGEPDRDDFGLPPVDIEVPDDARDLDRDVQAYRRELRAARRRRRLRGLYTPLTRDGLVLPLLAGCLVMVIISGVLLTVFSSGQSGADHPVASVTPAPSAAGSVSNPVVINPPSPADSSSQHPRRVTDVSVMVAGRPVPLYSLLPAVLALTPAHCQCTAVLRQLRRQAAKARFRVYVIGNKSDITGVALQASEAGQAPGGVADDSANVLGKALRPSGLTAAFVRSGGVVTDLARNLLPSTPLDGQFERLAAIASPGAPPPTAPSTSP
jgi:hypothetical protein